MDWHAKLDRWNQLKDEIKNLQAEERELRNELFSASFPEAQEGTNKVDIGDGRELVGTQRMNRKVDKDAYEKLPTKYLKYFRRAVTLNLPAYRKAPIEDRRVIDGALIIKPGLPGLQLKEKKKK